MLNLSAALGRLVLSGRELARLSGFSSRVTGLIDVIDDVNSGSYERRYKPKDADSNPATTVSGHSVGPAVSREAAGSAADSGQRVQHVPASDAMALKEAELQAQRAAQARVNAAAGDDPSHRNAGVAGVNLAIEHTPTWAQGRKTSQNIATAGMSTTAESLAEGAGNVHLYDASPSLSASVPADTPQNALGSGAPVVPAVEGGEDSNTNGGARRGEDGAMEKTETDTKVVGGAPLQRSGSVLVNEDSVIEFTDVPLVTPTGEVLIKALSFKVNLTQKSAPSFPNRLRKLLKAHV